MKSIISCVQSKPDHCVVTKTYCPGTNPNPNKRENNCFFGNRGSELQEFKTYVQKIKDKNLESYLY